MQQVRCNTCLDAEHQLLSFAGRLHGLGRELGGAGDKGHLSRDHILRSRIQHDAHLGAQCYPACHGLGQEEADVDVRDIHHVQHLAACADHLAGLGQPVLHAAVARGGEFAVLHIGIDALDGGGSGRHRRFRTYGLGLGSVDGRLGCRGLCLGGLECGLGATHAGPVVVQFLLR